MSNKRNFVFFATIKNIDKYIHTYRQILNFFEAQGCKAIDPWLVAGYPFEKDILPSKIATITEDSHRQLAKSEFAVCEFSEKSRTVIFQAMLAIEKKVPLLCLVQQNQYDNVPELLRHNKSGLVTIKTYQDPFELRAKIDEFIKETEPLKKRFNVMLTTTTLKELEVLSQKLELTKADIIRSLISREFKRLHDE